MRLPASGFSRALPPLALTVLFSTGCLSPAADRLGEPGDVEGKADGPIPPDESRTRLLELLDFMWSYTGNVGELDLDRAALAAEAVAILDGGGASEPAYHTAAWHVFRAFRNSHSDYRADGCGVTLPVAGQNRLGACLQPLGDGYVVTAVSAQNLVGWERGDRIVEVSGLSGGELHAAVLSMPACSGGIGSPSAERQHVAAMLLALLGGGEQLVVESPSGSRRVMEVPTGVDDPIDCLDPLGRPDHAQDVIAYRRADGIAVIRLPSFYPRSVAPPEDPSEEAFAAYLDAVTRVYREAFDSVSDAPAIVWDARANTGGLTPAALAIVGGMPTARALELSYCEGRIPGSDPPQMFPDARGGEYAVEPGGPFEYHGGVAVIVDGRTVSAGDYFALAVRRATGVPLVGSPTAGGYGGPGPQYDGLYGSHVVTDGNRCVDARGAPLEGYGVEPTLVVDHDPADLAVGVDTLLEAAARAAMASM